MPVYQFICEKHGGFEKITIKAEWKNIRCPKCGDKSRLDKKSNTDSAISVPQGHPAL